jgi:ubiquinone biosynthesis protein Coq4
MIEASQTVPFEAIAQAGISAADVQAAATAAKAGDMASRARLAAAFAHAGFAAPERIAEIYDAAALGWYGKPIAASPMLYEVEAPHAIPSQLWTQFWAIMNDPDTGRDAKDITVRSAALGGTYGPDFIARVARVARTYPDVARIEGAAYPPKITLEALAACPPGSMGRQFHDLIVDNKFDLEVLDREELGLHLLPKPLDYLNARILQCHDLWHIIADYHTTALHEIGISAFQMAQFGHSYSSMFLAVVATRSALTPIGPMGDGFTLLMDVILSAWVHGRESGPLIAVPWEDVWDQPVDTLRARYNVAPYQSPYPADLVEQFMAMSAAQAA